MLRRAHPLALLCLCKGLDVFSCPQKSCMVLSRESIGSKRLHMSHPLILNKMLCEYWKCLIGRPYNRSSDDNIAIVLSQYLIYLWMPVGLLIWKNVPNLVCLAGVGITWTLHLVCNWSGYMIPCCDSWNLQKLPGLLMSFLINITAKIFGLILCGLYWSWPCHKSQCQDENWIVNILNFFAIQQF